MFPQAEINVEIHEKYLRQTLGVVLLKFKPFVTNAVHNQKISCKNLNDKLLCRQQNQNEII